MATEGYRVKEYHGPVKRYCQTLSLKDGDPELIRAYRQIHSREDIWPEVLEGIKSVGILEMEIYILDTTLFMIVETPVDFDWDEAMGKLAALPRQAEWEDYVARFQKCALGESSNDKWKMMERMFHLYE